MSDTTSDAAAPPDLSPGGLRLRSFLDGLPVESEWLAGHRIVWQTGQQDGPDGVGPEDHTHCSAFAAAVGLYLDIYMLRPPNHSQELLANAQVAWLGGKQYTGPSAAESLWRDLGRAGDSGAIDAAVAAARAGKLVVAGYVQPSVTDPVTGKLVEKSGHVVVVLPQSAAIDAGDGPLVTMAGDKNWHSIAMREAFDSHPGAWPDAIRMFVHDTDLEAEFAAADGVG